MKAMTDPLALWHQAIVERDISLLDEVLAEDITFRPPTYWKERQGKAVTKLLLSNVVEIFEDFEYRRQWIDGDEWALEFSARIGDLHLKGIDLMHLEDGEIVELEVLIRPPTAVEALKNEMGRRLTELGMS